MKALKSHPHTKRPRRINRQITLAKYTAGLLLALVGLISAAPMKGPIQLVSAETVALSWNYTGSLNTPRRLHTATLLPDGKVLVAGGYAADGSLDSAELYDPTTGKWNATGRLNGPRDAHTAMLLEDGKVVILGGQNAYHRENGNSVVSSVNRAELYDPKDERWSVTGSLNTPRFGYTATLLKNGKVLVVGGFDVFSFEEVPLDTVELYDPDTGVWSFTGNLNTAVESHTATLLQNGKVLVLGEFSAQLYDPDTGAWSSTGHLNTARTSYTATLLPDGKVLVAGGLRVADSGLPVSVSSSELYDPDTGAWSSTGHKTPRTSHTATILPDGKPMIVGGFWFPGDGPPSRSLDSVELGNPVTPPKITMASVAGKKLIVVGENFDPDSVILINGEEQKTWNDDQNPGTTLIGKKAGKKIKPGDRLQVRNSDDILSEEFIFTGS